MLKTTREKIICFSILSCYVGCAFGITLDDKLNKLVIEADKAHARNLTLNKKDCCFIDTDSNTASKGSPFVDTVLLTTPVLKNSYSDTAKNTVIQPCN